MKTKEFIKRVEELGYFVNSFKGYYEIRDVDKVIIAVINKTIFLQFSTDYPGWDKLCDKDRKELYNLVIKYASTPIEDREEDTKDKLLNEINRILNYVKDFDNKGLIEILNGIEKLEDDLEIFANDFKYGLLEVEE